MWFLWRGRKPVLPRLESLPGGGDGGQVLAHRLDDSATPHPQSGTDAHTAVQQQPNGRGHVWCHAAGCVNEPQSDQRANGVTAGGRMMVFRKTWTDTLTSSQQQQQQQPPQFNDRYKHDGGKQLAYLTSFPPWANDPKQAVRI